MPEADGGATDTGSDEPDTRSVDADAGKKNDMSLEVLTEFDEPIDEATTVRVEVEPPSGDSVERVTWTDGYDGGKTFELSRKEGNVWSVEWQPAGGGGAQTVVAAAESVGGATARVSFNLKMACMPREMYRDADADGYGASTDPNTIPACGEVYDRNGERFVAQKGDCNDAYESVNPDAEERCDGFDTDCNEEGEPDFCSQTSTLPGEALQVVDAEVYDEGGTCRVAVVGSSRVSGGQMSDIQGWVRIYECGQLKGEGISSRFGFTKFFGGTGTDRPIAVSWEDASKLHVIGNVVGGGASAPFVQSYRLNEMGELVETISEQPHDAQKMIYIDAVCEPNRCIVIGFKTVSPMSGGEEHRDLFIDQLTIDHRLGNQAPGDGTAVSDLHLFSGEGDQTPTTIVADPTGEAEERYWVGGYTNEEFWTVTASAGGTSGFVAPLRISKQAVAISSPVKNEVIFEDSVGYARVGELVALKVEGSPRIYYTGTDGGTGREGGEEVWRRGDVFVAGFQPGSGGGRPAWRCTFDEMAEQLGPRLAVGAGGRIAVVGQTEGVFDGRPLPSMSETGGFVRAIDDITACSMKSPEGRSLIFGTKNRTSPKGAVWLPQTDFLLTGGIQSNDDEESSGFLRLFDVSACSSTSP